MQTVLTSESSLRTPGRLIRSIMSDVRSSRELAVQLLLRNLRNTYRQSLLGYVWAFIPAVAIALAFTLMGKARMVNIDVADMPYVAYVIINVVLWQTFAESLNAPINALSESRSLLMRINFPREAMLFAKFAEVLINFVVKIPLLIAVVLLFDVGATWRAFLVPLAVLPLVLLGASIGLLLAPIAVLYKDISKGLPILLLFWMLVSPVVFPVPQDGILSIVVALNPVTPLLVTARELLSGGNLSHGHSFVVLAGVGVAGSLLGTLWFRLAVPYVAERT